MKRPHSQDDLEFMPDVLAASRFSVRLRYHVILLATTLFFIIALIWAAVAELDEITTGPGKVIASSKTQQIQNLEGGILAELLVREGDVVEKDQPLLRLDDTRFASTYKEAQQKYNDLIARSQRLATEGGARGQSAADVDGAANARYQQELFAARQRELDNKVDILKQQQAQKQQELRELRSRVEKLRVSYSLAKQELSVSEPLVREGAISPVEVLRLQRSVNDIKGDLDEALLGIPRLEAAIAETGRKMDDVRISFRSKALDDLNQANAELAETRETLAGLKDRVTRTVIRSPVRGIVKQLKVTTIGGVVQPGMDIMEIVPLDDSLLIEARIRPADIAFLHPGQSAMVKLSAYDYSIYGGISGKVEHISADTLTEKAPDTGREESYYRILVRTENNQLGRAQQSLKIIPGMTATVDIKTGRKTVLDYLLKPILKVKERALTEH